jgi:hypothetical protein
MRGVIPVQHDIETGKVDMFKDREIIHPLLMGQVAGAIDSVLTADEIVSDMVRGAVHCALQVRGMISAKL